MMKTRYLNRVVVAVFRLACLLFGVTITVLGLGSSCQARYRDVSSDSKYAERIGQRCMVLKGLRAHGVTFDLSKKLTDQVDVTALPGIGGPEITFTEPIPKGTTLNVIGVRRCWNCLFFDRIDYEVEISQVPRLANYHVFARSETLSPDQAQCATSR